MHKNNSCNFSVQYILHTTLLCIVFGTVLYFVPLPTVYRYLYSYTKEVVVNVQFEHNSELPMNELDRLHQNVDQLSNAVCDIQVEGARFDCYPGPGATRQGCEARGCCWEQAGWFSGLRRQIDVPYCYFPRNYPTYTMRDLQTTRFGYTAFLTRHAPSPWPADITNLTLDVYMETPTRLHFKLYDSKKARYEVPLAVPVPDDKSSQTDYTVKFQYSPFAITVTRASTGAVLFDSAIEGAPLIFADQFIQISSKVPSKVLYGLGEHTGPLQRDFSQWNQFSFWARDQPPQVGLNLYGTHPFFVSLEGDGKAHGVFLLNSNAMDVDLQPLPAITYRTVGGILDFYVFTGPSPDQVVSQYTEVIGRPILPSYWSLGFHLCRYGYGSSAKLKQAIKRTRDGKFPYDTQWSDIDYMDNHLDWTYDHQSYADLPDIVKDLHNNGQHYVMIVDPGISNTQKPGTYAPYDEGVADNVFIKNASGKILTGSVWPGKVAFPDFTHPNATDYWYRSMADFHAHIPFDGLWIDMNEPSNFVYGSADGCTSSSLDKPPYTPGVVANDLAAQTVCSSAQQYLSSHYNLHSMYGHFEAIATRKGLTELLGKRSLIISRSSFAGTGHYAGHWTGDNAATWDDLYYSIPAIINFQMYGIAQVGADICGFRLDTTEELCTRWMQLGAFYPFMRNHNDLKQKEQDPGVFSKAAQDAMRSVLQLRYSLLANLYTLFYLSHTQGLPVVRPLAFQYPNDSTTYGIDRQFLWGSSLLVSPATYQGQSSVHAYFPPDVWYDYFTGVQFISGGMWRDLDTPLSKINVHLRGGSIIFTQQYELQTTKMRNKPYNMTVALDRNGAAEGLLYWDDGESINSTERKAYTLVKVSMSAASLVSEAVVKGYTEGMTLAGIKVMGLSKSPSHVTLNSKTADFTFNANKVLSIFRFKPADLLEKLTVTLTF